MKLQPESVKEDYELLLEALERFFLAMWKHTNKLLVD